MDLNNLVLDVFKIVTKAYSIIFLKPYATVKAQFTPQRDSSGKATKEFISFTISNASFGDIDVQRIWFLTSFNRQIFSQSIDSKLPAKVMENDRVNFSVPVEELKAALNRRVGETIFKAVVFDKNERKFDGRVGKAIQEALAN